MKQCSQCGAELAPDDAGGICAVCLLTGGLLADPTMVTSAAAAATAGPHLHLDADTFGPYTILRLLGEGGMGTVYLAEQTSPIHRKVALKVVKPGMETRSILSRFEYERQALASMDHPNIARVYDASASGKGRPYFVMEYIEGEPITSYCDRRRLNTEERLDLFVPVCHAVQHAHQKGVIHRDLKPSNILVMEQDGRPVPKVIDFGIAKATDQRNGENTMLTQFGQFVGTPEYISPEQADLVTNDVDTSSDVYSLGVVLYELLVGAVPFDGALLRKAGLAELLRVIREDEPPSLPAKLTGMGDTATQVAERRSTDRASLRRQLAGELNWIVLKAVEKNRQQRYGSPSELAADLRRHLEDLPVLASPPSTTYRLRKFVRRHRGAVLAGAGVAAALILGITATAWQAREARRGRAEALTQKSAAERHSREAFAERAKAEQQAAEALHQKGVADERLGDVRTLAHSMLFDLDDQVRDLAGSTQARETLARLGMQYLNKVAEAAKDDPRLQPQLGAAYLKVGDLQGEPGHPNLRDMEGARSSYSKSVAILEEQVKGNPADRGLRHLLTIATLRKAQTEALEENRNRGIEQALRVAERLAAQEPADLQAQSDLAEALVVKQHTENLFMECIFCGVTLGIDTDSAELAVMDTRYGRRAVEIRERILAEGPKSAQARWELACADIELGFAMWEGSWQDTLDVLHKAMALLDGLIRENPANVQYKRDRAQALSMTAWGQQIAGRREEARQVGSQALALIEQIAATDPRNAAFRLDLSKIQFALGGVLYLNESRAEGMDYMKKALAIQEEQAALHPGNADFLLQMAQFRTGMGRAAAWSTNYKDALIYHRESESRYRRLIREHPEEKAYVRRLAAELVLLADEVVTGENKSEAIPIYQESISLWEKLGPDPGGENQFGMGKARASLAHGFAVIARNDEAISQSLAAIAIFDKLLATTTKSTALQAVRARTSYRLADVYRSRGDRKSALAAALQAATFQEANFAALPNNFRAMVSLYDTYNDIQNDYGALGDHARGIAAGLRCVELVEHNMAISPGEGLAVRLVGNAYDNLGITYRLAGRLSESLATYRKLAALFETVAVEKMDSTLDRAGSAGIMLWGAVAFRGMEEQQEASPLTRRAVLIMEAVAQGDPKNDRWLPDLKRAYQVSGDIGADLNDLALYLQMRSRSLKLDMGHPQETTEYWRSVGINLLDIGSAQDLTGNPEAAAQSRQQAMDDLLQSRRLAEALVTSSQGKDLTAIVAVVQANKWLGFASERSGDLKAALEYRKGMLSAAQQLNASGQRTARFRDILANATGAVARLQSLVDPKIPIAPAEAARGWRLYSTECTGGSAYPCVDETLKAVEIDRTVIAGKPDAEERLALAIDLRQASDVYLIVYHRSTGEARSAALRHSQAALAECQRILTELQGAGAMPETDQIRIGIVAMRLSTLNKLAELQK